VEQVMEEDNHSLLQTKLTEDTPQQTPQLLMLSSHATHGTTSVATFSIIISIGGQRGLTLVDSENTDSFLDYTFVSKGTYNIIATTAKTVKVVGGGQLETSAVT
jgi:hypothetical protein